METKMNFGKAIEALKQGKKVAREGWNGKGMYLFLHNKMVVEEFSFTDVNDSYGVIVDSMIKERGNVEFCASICMKTADNKVVVGWLASQTDMLSEDWIISENI